MPNLLDLFRELSLFAKLTMAVAIAAFGLAVSYVVRPTAQKLTMMRPVSLATIFATITGLFGGWIVVFANTAATPDGRFPPSSFYRGVSESLVVGFVCFGFLAAAWVLVAVGMLGRSQVDVR